MRSLFFNDVFMDVAFVGTYGSYYEFLQKCCVSSFIILLSGEGLTFFSINNRANFLGEKK